MDKNILTVVKSNKLIEAGYRLTLNEQRLVLACISQVNAKEILSNQDCFEITAIEFARLFSISENRTYSELKVISDKLYERSIILDIPNPKNKIERLKTRWISSIRYMPDEGKIQLRFALDILPFLSQLKESFTKYKLIHIAGMTSIYGIRLYELLVQWNTKGKIELEVKYLKEKLQLNDKKYQRIDNLKSRVIEPAINQINEHSDIWVKYSQKKRGRRISHFVFTFGYKAGKQTKKSTKQTKKSMTLLEYCNLPENHRRTTGKTDPEIMKMMHADNIFPKI